MRKRTALITGASRGIGFAIVSLLKEKGYNVLTPARDELNLLSNESVDEYLSSLNQSVDILVNNAGINPIASITEISDVDIEKTFQTNLISPIRLARGLVPSMIEQNFGRIVNISSIWSEISKPKRNIYSATKAGLNGVTRSMAVELAQHNILINAVAPGFVNTELTKKNNTEEEIRAIADTIPSKRLAEPSEIAELTEFLCSERNTYITGQTIFIDGGFTCI